MTKLLQEIYKSHQRRSENLSKLIQNLELDLDVAYENLKEFQTVYDEINAINEKWKEIRSRPGASKRKTPEQLDDELRIKEMKQTHPRNEYKKAITAVKKLEEKLQSSKSSYSIYDMDDLDSFDFEKESTDDEDEFPRIPTLSQTGRLLAIFVLMLAGMLFLRRRFS